MGSIRLLLCILAIGISVQNVNAAKILFFGPTPSKSHLIVSRHLLMELVKRGHEVTKVSSFPEIKQIENYRDISLPIRPDLMDVLNRISTKGQGELVRSFAIFQKLLSEAASDAIKNPVFQEVMANEKFDLLIVSWFMTDFGIGLGAHFKCPIVVISPAGVIKAFEEFIGNISPVSSVPNMLLGPIQSMTFFDRVKNMLLRFIDEALYTYMYYLQQSYYDAHFPANRYPPYGEVRKNISLALINIHFTQSVPRPYLPNMIEVGGLQLEHELQPMEEDLQKWMDEAEHGVIFLSMGSNVKFTMLPTEKLNIFIEVFSKLKQRIVWTYDGDSMPNKPDNVMISKWFPQHEILAHKNTRLFITHGGLGSIVEAKYHGVPVIGMPMFADQPTNVKITVEEGWGYKLDFPTLDKTALSNGLDEMLNNPKYLEKVKYLSLLSRDRPQTSKELAVFWIEYVIRHKGAPHMRFQGVDLNFFQRNSLDVLAFFTIAVYLIFKILKLSLLLVCKGLCKLCKRTKKEKVN